MAFAALESKVTTAINTLMRLRHDEGAALAALMQNFNSRIELFAAMAQMNCQDNKLKTLAARIVSLLRQANSDRNNLLHDMWNSYQPVANTFGKIRYKLDNGHLRKLDHAVHVDVEVIKDTAEFSKRIMQCLDDWLVRFRTRDNSGSWPPPLPEKFYEGSPLHNRARDRKKKAPPQPPQSSQA
jgi:hypothetical protein